MFDIGFFELLFNWRSGMVVLGPEKLQGLFASTIKNGALD